MITDLIQGTGQNNLFTSTLQVKSYLCMYICHITAPVCSEHSQQNCITLSSTPITWVGGGPQTSFHMVLVHINGAITMQRVHYALCSHLVVQGKFVESVYTKQNIGLVPDAPLGPCYQQVS